MPSVCKSFLLILVLCYFTTGSAGWKSTAKPDVRKESNRVNSMPASLRHLFVCVTFHWEVASLVFLRQVLRSMQLYPTLMDVRVITNQPQRLKSVMRSWDTPASVYSPKGPLSHPYELAFAHRAYMKEAFEKTDPEYTAFMYLESDIRVPWRALLGWAADEPVLAQLGFQRAFYRVEPIEQTGQLGLTDQVERIDISTYARTVHTRAQLANGTIEEKHFLQMPNPYMGMWIAGRARMTNFTSSLHWTKQKDPWEIREMAACGLQFVGAPDGFLSSALVPYDPESGQLDADSAIGHVSNKYCGAHTRDGMSLDHGNISVTMARHCTIDVEDFLVGVR